MDIINYALSKKIKKYVDDISSSNQVQSDWNQNDETAADYVKNRPFYMIGEKTLIDWDGDVGDREIITITENDETINYLFCYSEDILTAYEIIGSKCLLTVNGESNEITITSDNIKYNEDVMFVVLIDGIPLAYIINQTISEDNMSIHPGVWLVHPDALRGMPYALKLEKKDIKCLDEKYLPDTIARTENVMSKVDPVGSGSFSMNRKEGSIVGVYSHTEGDNTTASGSASHAEGYYTTASGKYSHAEGSNISNNDATFASRTVTIDGTTSIKVVSTTAQGVNSHAEGTQTLAYGYDSHSEGYRTNALKDHSHAEGNSTTASGGGSHAEGYMTTASGERSHAEGENTTAFGGGSHAEGFHTTASGSTSHAEGYYTTASGSASHAEGQATTASGGGSHAEGFHTKASSHDQHVQGKWNIEDSTNTYAHIVGNGTSNTARSNAHTLDWDGNAWFAGGIELTSPNGKRYRFTVSDDGTLSSVVVTE